MKIDLSSVNIFEDNELELDKKITDIMMVLPNIIDPTVPIGKDDSENVRFFRDLIILLMKIIG